jgi:hypothetical protein
MTPALFIFSALIAGLLIGASLVWGAPIFAIPVLVILFLFWAVFTMISRAKIGTTLPREAKDQLDHERGSPVPRH